MSKPILYLACPYTDPDARIRTERYRAANLAAAELIKEGLIVFSPITMTHPIDEILAGSSATLGSDYWLAFDEAFMEACGEIGVLMLDGWDTSAGVQREIAYFSERKRPIRYIKP